MPVARRNRRQTNEVPDIVFGSNQTFEQWQGIEYVVRSLSGSGSAKTYRCPGCDQEIKPATPHVVVWPDGDDDATHRRHWHRVCWDKRDNRRSTQHRGGMPRY